MRGIRIHPQALVSLQLPIPDHPNESGDGYTLPQPLAYCNSLRYTELMAVVTHPQRVLLEAIEALERVEAALRGKVENPGVAARLDAMIEELTGLVGRMGEGVRGAAGDAATATQELSDEGMIRAQGQRNADRC